jgi:hypothetical protein
MDGWIHRRCPMARTREDASLCVDSSRRDVESTVDFATTIQSHGRLTLSFAPRPELPRPPLPRSSSTRSTALSAYAAPPATTTTLHAYPCQRPYVRMACFHSAGSECSEDDRGGGEIMTTCTARDDGTRRGVRRRVGRGVVDAASRTDECICTQRNGDDSAERDDDDRRRTMDGVSPAWVRASDVREQLRRLGRDDISDDAIDRFLARRRRDARERRRRGAETDYYDVDDASSDDDATTDSESISESESDEIPPRRRGASIVDRRPPWNGDAFEVIPAERAPTSSARLDALPRRGGKIDVVQVNAAYARAWSSGAPAVVSGEKRPKVGFAEKFRAAHESEALRKTKAAAAAAAARRRRQ